MNRAKNAIRKDKKKQKIGFINSSFEEKIADNREQKVVVPVKVSVDVKKGLKKIDITEMIDKIDIAKERILLVLFFLSSDFFITVQ